MSMTRCRSGRLAAIERGALTWTSSATLNG
jgi:hypothetical protein